MPVHPLCFPCIAADLGKQQVNTERRILVRQMALQLLDLIPEHVGGIVDPSKDTETAGICDGSSELGASGDVHARQKDRVVDLEKIGYRRPDLLCKNEAS